MSRWLLALAVLAAPLAPLPLRAEEKPDWNRVFGGEEAIALLRGARQAQAWRLPEGSFYRDAIDQYTFTAGPIEVPAAEVEKLRAALLDPRTYGWEFAKGCEPVYGVRVRFTADQGTLDLLFCFECDILTVYHQGKAVGGEDFDAARGKFLAAIKPLFPEDKAIQGLK